MPTEEKVSLASTIRLMFLALGQGEFTVNGDREAKLKERRALSLGGGADHARCLREEA